MKFYVGLINKGPSWFKGWHVFKSSTPPTPEAFAYSSVIGPFRTKRAAIWATNNVGVNPHFSTVADAERISKAEGRQ